jgi:rubrerythrin
MDEREKAKIRISRWIDHNASHQEEYEKLAEQLEEKGEKEAAFYIRELAAYNQRGIEALRKALATLEG